MNEAPSSTRKVVFRPLRFRVFPSVSVLRSSPPVLRPIIFCRRDAFSARPASARFFFSFPPRQARKVMDSIKGGYKQPIATECKEATVYWPAEVCVVWHRSCSFVDNLSRVI